MQVDICSKCHPFFTGEERFVDRQGRVEKFNQKIIAAKANKATQKTSKTAKTKADDAEAKSYRQILQEQKKAVKVAPQAA